MVQYICNPVNTENDSIVRELLVAIKHGHLLRQLHRTYYFTEDATQTKRVDKTFEFLTQQ